MTDLLMPKKEKNKEPEKKKIARVFILDDHPVLRHGLAELIKQQADLTVCGEAASVDESFSAIETAKPDIVVVDITLSGANGIEFIKTAKEQHPSMLFLVHSMHDETLYASRDRKSVV